MTVWRKLHIEVDSMEAVATSGSEQNFETGTITAYTPNTPSAGQSILDLSIRLRDEENVFENGRVEIAGRCILERKHWLAFFVVVALSVLVYYGLQRQRHPQKTAIEEGETAILRAVWSRILDLRANPSHHGKFRVLHLETSSDARFPAVSRISFTRVQARFHHNALYL